MGVVDLLLLVIGLSLVVLVLVIGWNTRQSAHRQDVFLQKIEAETSYNHGSSLKDMVRSVRSIQLEEQTLAQKAAFRMEIVSEAVDVALYETNETGQVVWCNPAYMRFWGFSSMEDAMSEKWLDRLTPAGKDLAVARLSSIIRSQTSFRYTNTLDTGETIELIGEPIFVDGNFTGWTGAVRFVSDPTF